MSIAFTQYMRPDGRAVPVSINRPEYIETLASAIQAKGFRFECEHLTTGEVSLTITDDDGDADIEICENGPAVSAAVDRLIERFAGQRAITTGAAS